MNSAALILGGYVNAYSIIKELSKDKDIKILLLDEGEPLAKYSNKCSHCEKLALSDREFIEQVSGLADEFGYLVIYPTSDAHIELLIRVSKEICDLCYVPVNLETAAIYLNKNEQYKLCDRINIPYPKSLILGSLSDLKEIEKLCFPIIIKPTTRLDINQNIFRNLIIKNASQWKEVQQKIEKYIEKGYEFVASEYIPGSDNQIYAFVCVQDKNSEIIGEWSGRKLSQHPDNCGVASSAENIRIDDVITQGRKIVTEMKNHGITQPEFKFDERDGKYKLMEVNLRSMMWNRVGALSGVNLHLTQYYTATLSDKLVLENQSTDIKISWVLMMHEIPNLILRKDYWKVFRGNIARKNNRNWAIYDPNDIKPFIASIPILLKKSARACLRRLKPRSSR